MSKTPTKSGKGADDASATHAGSVYYQEQPRSRTGYPERRGTRRRSSPPAKSKRSSHLGHAILLANIRTFTLVALFMFGLLGLAVFITGKAWHSRQVDAESGRPTTQPAAPAPTQDVGVMMDRDGQASEPRVRMELDTEAMRRAVFMQKRAEDQLAVGNYDQAIQRFREALDIWPHLGEVWAQLGRAYLETRQFAEAEIALERAVEGDPAKPDLLNDLGVALLYQNKVDTALNLFETVNDLNPSFAPAHFNMALAHFALEQEAAAERALDAFLRLKPADAQAIKEKAYLQASRGDYEEALESLRSGFTTAPDWAPLYIDAAAVAALMGRLDVTIRYLDMAEALTSPDLVYRVYQQPAFRNIRLSERGRSFELSLAERAREILSENELEDDEALSVENTEGTAWPMQSTVY